MIYAIEVVHSDKEAGNSEPMDRDVVEEEYKLLEQALTVFLAGKAVAFQRIESMADGRRVFIEAEDVYAAKDAVAQYEARRKTGRLPNRQGASSCSICLIGTPASDSDAA